MEHVLRDTHKEMIREAGSEIKIVVVVVTDGYRERVVHHVPEYGDWEGYRDALEVWESVTEILDDEDEGEECFLRTLAWDINDPGLDSVAVDIPMEQIQKEVRERMAAEDMINARTERSEN